MIDLQADPRFWQRFLACAGFYKGAIDGLIGPGSRQALQDFQEASTALAGSGAGALDARTEGNIQTLLPAAQAKARAFMKALSDASLEARIISGTRTFAEQHALFEQRPKVTNADAGQSNHNFGVAWDIGIFDNGKYVPESPLYAQAGKIGQGMGLEWGGSWQKFVDEPHFQVVAETDLHEIAAKFEAGTPFLA